MEYWGAYGMRGKQFAGGLLKCLYAFPAPIEQSTSSEEWRRRLREGEHISSETQARRRQDFRALRSN
jgi:hypothetical protein